MGRDRWAGFRLGLVTALNFNSQWDIPDKEMAMAEQRPKDSEYWGDLSCSYGTK